MDFFQEAQWFFDEDDRVTWYQEVARKIVLAPRVPRYGIMTQSCSTLFSSASSRTDCNPVISERVIADEPLLLFSDIGNLEMNDPCKACIETEMENEINELLDKATTMFSDLAVELRIANQTELSDTMEKIVEKLSLQEVMDYYTYKTIRFLYGNLGGQVYFDIYQEFQPTCRALAPDFAEENCGDITLTEAGQVLRRHADHAYSSVVTAGSPLPFWGDDGEGLLLQGNSPVGGSGINMSGTEFSAMEYIAMAQTNITFDITSTEWQSMVETDPVYRWFLAGETPMTGSCSNGRLNGTNGTLLDYLPGDFLTGDWCTKYNEPFEEKGTYTQQYFARMWFDLLADSPSFLNLTQGECS